MASAPTANLPLFYNGVQPLSSQLHAGWKTRPIDLEPMLATQHAIPLTVEEFTVAQRHYPIVFSVGDEAVPLALMGLNEGSNVFTGDDQASNGIYIPAYLRRYPFMLAKLREGADELSLCFDPASNGVGEFEDGEALFDGDQPSENTKAILQFCEQFEQAGARTQAFMAEIKKAGLLMDGEVSIQPSNSAQPFIYRGFQMVDEAKLAELRGDELRKMNQSGLLALVYAHLFSLPLIRDIFARQMAQGKVPTPQLLEPANA
jgi:hypothetical protein